MSLWQKLTLVDVIDGAARVIELLGTEEMKSSYYTRLTR